MDFNKIVNEIFDLDLKSTNLVNEYSNIYKGLSVDSIMDKLNQNMEFKEITEKNKTLRDKVSKYLLEHPIYLTGCSDENGFLIDVARVKKDNTYALFIYTDLLEIENDKTYLQITYTDLRDYLLNSKEIKRIIVNKNTVNALLGKSNFIRGNMYGLLIKNRLELE